MISEQPDTNIFGIGRYRYLLEHNVLASADTDIFAHGSIGRHWYWLLILLTIFKIKSSAIISVWARALPSLSSDTDTDTIDTI